MHTGTKVAIGVVALAGIAAIGWYALSQPQEPQRSSGQQQSSGDNSNQSQGNGDAAAAASIVGSVLGAATQITTAVLANQRPPAAGTQVQNQTSTPQR